MEIKLIKEKFFSDDFKRIAESGGVGVQFIRTLVSKKRKVLELANGDFILTSFKTIIFKREKPDYSDPKTRPEGYYRLVMELDIPPIAYWTGKEWLLIGDESEYWDDELSIKSIELVELKAK